METQVEKGQDEAIAGVIYGRAIDARHWLLAMGHCRPGKLHRPPLIGGHLPALPVEVGSSPPSDWSETDLFGGRCNPMMSWEPINAERSGGAMPLWDPVRSAAAPEFSGFCSAPMLVVHMIHDPSPDSLALYTSLHSNYSTIPSVHHSIIPSSLSSPPKWQIYYLPVMQAMMPSGAQSS